MRRAARADDCVHTRLHALHPPSPHPTVNAPVFFAVAAPTLSLSSGISAAVRPFRVRSVAGLSEPATITATACTLMWATYGVLTSDPSQLATNLPMLVLRSALIALMFSACADRRRFVSLCGVALAGVVAATLAGAAVVGLVASSVGFVQQLPQVWETLTNGRGPGLSVGSLALSIGSASMWAAYGATHGDLIVVGSSTFAVAVTAVLLAAALTPPGALLLAGRRAAMTAAHADVVVLRRCRAVAPAATRNAAEFFPTFAKVARERNRVFSERARRTPVPSRARTPRTPSSPSTH